MMKSVTILQPCSEAFCPESGKLTQTGRMGQVSLSERNFSKLLPISLLMVVFFEEKDRPGR